MENTSNITNTIIETINIIFKNLFTSIDNNLYEILDDLVFVNKNILTDKYFDKLFGTTTANGILLIANSLLIGFLIYFGAKSMMANFTYSKIETPQQFIFKCIIYGICMNCSFFIVEQIIDLNSNISNIIRGIGEDIFGKNICFTTLIKQINAVQDNSENIDIFSLEGIIQGTLRISLINLLFSYSLRYVLIKVLVLLSPFAFLSLTLEGTSHFFKSWYKSLFSLLVIQNFVAIVLLLLFSTDYTKQNTLNKFIYLGAIYALIKANTIVRELFGGLSTTVQSGITSLKLKN